MKIQKVTYTAIDGGMDHIGGVSTEYTDLQYDDKTLFTIKAMTNDANVAITLTGYEMDSLRHLVWRRI